MRVLLLNVPWQIEGRYGVRSGSRWPFTSLPEKDGRIHYIPFPFFLAYAVSLLKKKGKTVKLIDAIAEGIDVDGFFEKVNAYSAELIVIETSTPSFKNDLDIASKIKRDLPASKIALSGPHASVFVEQILVDYPFIEYVLVGEYEYTLLDLANALENNSNPKSILGLAYRENKRVKVNNRRPTIDDLDSLPWPERESLPIYNYNDAFAGLPLPNVQVWASRGCPFSCTFCLWPQTIYGEHKHRKRSPKDIVAEIEYLVKKFDFKAVYFDDDIFNADKKQVLAICDEIIKRGIKIPWAIMGVATLMDEEVLNGLARAGLYAVKYGIESTSPSVLKSCKKNLDLEKTSRIIQTTKGLGIKVHLTFCLGLPGETKSSIDNTIKFIRKVKPDSLQFSLATPFPGTDFFEYVDNKKWLQSKNWDDFDGNHKCNVRNEQLSALELEQIVFNLRNKFCLH